MNDNNNLQPRTDAEQALLDRVRRSPALNWRPTRRTAAGNLVLETTIAAGRKHPRMVRDISITQTTAGLVHSDGAPRPV